MKSCNEKRKAKHPTLYEKGIVQRGNNWEKKKKEPTLLPRGHQQHFSFTVKYQSTVKRHLTPSMKKK